MWADTFKYQILLLLRPLNVPKAAALRYCNRNFSLFSFSRILSEARELTEFPNLNGTSALEVLRIDRASIYSIPDSLCTTCPKLKSLYVRDERVHRSRF